LLFKLYKTVIERDFCFYEADKYKITEKDIVFDCGANMGLFAAYAASKGAMVYCFEPMSYIRNYLKEVQKLYPENIVIIPYGTGVKKESLVFTQTKNPGECSLNTSSNEVLYQEKVSIIKLDDFITATGIQPTFIKMDIEGSELMALKGSYNFLKSNKIVLSISLDHKSDDKILIPNFINNLDLNYNIFYYNKGESVNNSLFMLCK
jgi:FkbM family methyltransferase